MPPAATADTTRLWKSDDPAEWRKALDAYPDRLAALNDPKLQELDAWFWGSLGDAIRARDPNRLTAPELVRVVEWKLARGKFRPNLVKFARAHTEATAGKATSEALKRFGSSSNGDDRNKNKNWLEACLAPLCDLKGIGPATASAVLAAATPLIPMMSDELIAVALPNATASQMYSMQRLQALVDKTRAKANKVGMTPREVERAIFAEAARTKKPKTAAAKTTGVKRKAS
jgi:hypothetical protein